MLQAPDIPEGLIVSHVRDAYGLPAEGALFLPLGADLNTAVYRIDTGGEARYFLKLRRGPCDEASVVLPRLLADQGAGEALAAIRTRAGELYSRLQTFTLILYPFVEGVSGFDAPLSEGQWIELGAFVRRLHGVDLPPRLEVPRERWSPEGRGSVADFLQRAAGRPSGDPVAARLSRLLEARGGDIRSIVERAGDLAAAVSSRGLPHVPCHTDLHAGNVLIAADGSLHVVDWDEPLLAPRERDLMFVGGGVGAVWNEPAGEALFYQGYGPVEVDRAALAYYRYERIVQDVAVVCRHVFLSGRRDDDRARGLRQLESQFLPGGVVAIAHRTYDLL